jgi:hypothetical protein
VSVRFRLSADGRVVREVVSTVALDRASSGGYFGSQRIEDNVRRGRDRPAERRPAWPSRSSPGAYWLDVGHKKRRKRKRVRTGKAGKRAAELAAVRIAARLAEGDTSILDPPRAAGPVPTFAVVAKEWCRKYPLLHTVRPGTIDNYRSFTEMHSCRSSAPASSPRSRRR